MKAFIFNILYFIVKYAVWLYYKVVYFTRVTGKHHMPKGTHYIIACSHHSNHDPLFLGSNAPGRVSFLAKEELFRNPIARYLLMGIDLVPIKRGSNTELSTFKTILSVIKSGRNIVIYPEGTRYTVKKEDVKPGAVLFAIKGQVPIVPMYISGEYAAFRRMRLIIGQPIYYTESYDKITDTDTKKALSVELIERIYALGDGV